jgi:hypothetical protein
MAKGHREAARSVLDGREHDATLGEAGQQKQTALLAQRSYTVVTTEPDRAVVRQLEGR